MTYAPINGNAAGATIKAIMWMGDPGHTPGVSYNVGTSTASGVSKRPPPAQQLLLYTK